MRKALIVLAAVAALAACGGGGEASENATATTSSAASESVDPDEYADEIVAAFREVHPVGAVHYEVPVSDWRAFVSTIEALTPPEDEKVDHERMVAGFQAYADAAESAEETCAARPGPGGPCSVAASTVNDRWTEAMDRTYEIPGLSWDTLLN